MWLFDGMNSKGRVGGGGISFFVFFFPQRNDLSKE